MYKLEEHFAMKSICIVSLSKYEIIIIFYEVVSLIIDIS